MTLLKTLFFIGLVYLISCKPEISNVYQHLQGKAMGTTYSIKYKGENNLQQEVDSLLAVFNTSLSTYDSTSTISRFNKSEQGICYHKNDDIFFLYSLNEAIRISKLSEGSFDPTIAPLVNYYGFGYQKKDKPTSINQKSIDSIKLLIGIDKIEIVESGDSICINKKYPGVKLDLNASAPGHGVDEIAKLLMDKNINDFMIEIGGEVRAKGKNDKGKNWAIGINKPEVGVETNDILIPIYLNNKSLATSGNYRNFFDNGKLKLAHIIDPISGNAQPSDILSATIIADNCLTADAIATVCMVKGLSDAKTFIETQKGIDAFFIYKAVDKDSFLFYQSPHFSKHLINQ